MKKFINQQDMKQFNTADVFGLIRQKGKITRKQIGEITGLSWGAVSNITSRLIERSYIREIKAESAGVAGRLPFYLEVNSEEHFAVGIDINTAGLNAVIINLKNEVIARYRGKADFTSRESLLRDIVAFVPKVTALAGGHHLLGIGLAMQGVVDAANGISVSLSDCAGWQDIPLAYILREKTGIPTYLEHDPNCILYAAPSGDDEDSVLLRVDSGVGMAVRMGGKILDRPGIFEIGHTTVVRGGRLCACGRRGCLESYASQRGLAEAAGMPFEALADKARGGDREAAGLFSEAADCLALAVSNATQLLGIRRMILCGDMWKERELFYREFLEKVREYGNAELPDFSFTDTENASFGAALIAVRNTLKEINVTSVDRKGIENESSTD